MNYLILSVVVYYSWDINVRDMALKTLLLLLVVCISVKAETLFNPCVKDDVKCVGAATQTFMSKTYGGYPKLGIKPIDPLIVPSTDISIDEKIGLVLHFKNTNITGLKNLQIIDFKLDTDKNIGLMKMQADVSIVSDVEVELTKLQKVFKGPYTASTTIVGTSEYGANLKTVNGKQYFDLGPETTNCEILGEPIVSLGAELQGAIDKDNDASRLRPEYEAKKSALRKKALCVVLKQGFSTIISNLRSVANAFDKSAFFTDI
ncbi:unnamed protein product [Arctia plantaginis]|uniref:Juvenile hormone binding protein n=1 Tax=Arctia plantaginis TaxID=874455 RepID=A0A8S1B8W1_ARCPL|nr:unnamed protein product [Arctia plantaginis]